MTPEAYTQTLEEQQEEQADAEKVEQIWQTYDEDQSGKLEKGEAYKFLRVMMKEYTGEEPTDEMLANSFRVMDEDGSGDVSKDEALKFLKGY